MVYLHLGSNQLTGDIPPELHGLENLTTLDTSKNPLLSESQPSAIVSTEPTVVEGTSAADEGRCVESSGYCICYGTCPSFVEGWSRIGCLEVNDSCLCVAAEDGISTGSGSVTVNGVETYSLSDSFDECPLDGTSMPASWGD